MQDCKKNGSPLYGVTICKCPRCEREHKMKIWWTGRGQAPKFCDECRWWVEMYDNVEEGVKSNVDTHSIRRAMMEVKANLYG